MGKRGYNWKARQVVATIIDDSPSKKIKLDLDASGTYDQSNALVLPSKKRKTKIKGRNEKVQRFLSTKQRKRLEKIVEKKKKKKNRVNLLEALAQVQATPDELQNLISIASVQTKGLKKYFSEQKTKSDSSITGGEHSRRSKISSIAGTKRKLLAEENEPPSNNPNVVGFESSSAEESEDDKVESERPHEPDASTEQVRPNLGEVKTTPAKKSNFTCDNGKVDCKNEVRKPAVFVQVNRSERIQSARLKLPILAEEQQIMETINENLITIIAGETGSGKTTQVPQFLYEAGYALNKMIAVTEPRRVAAISMSKRVAEEMALSSEQVSYLIRFEGNTTEDTKIKFMTDGVLLKELKNDFLLSKYSAVILDEVHERSVFTDILIGLLSRIVPLRARKGDPLKLIIMSATPRLEDFTENRRLFRSTPPVLKVEARQFPITVHFNRKTNADYLREAFKKTVKIHTTLPDGGVLVFLPGQRDINWLVRKLRRMFPLRHKEKILEAQRKKNTESDSEKEEERLGKTLKRKRKCKFKVPPAVNLDDYGMPGSEEFDGESDADVNLTSDEESGGIINVQPLWVLPMYSVLPSDKQSKVFDPPPPECRLCVVSTNIAETSLTIPSIKYVVDSGKVKTKLYDKVTGVTSHVVSWTSKASADQRAGRSGRTGPGHCYRLYSSAVFSNEFPEFSVPEIQKKPADDLFLQMKCMKISNVVNFPFPTAPDLLQFKMAERRLEILGAIKDSKVTPLGSVIANYPVLPRFGKMLALSLQHDLLPYTICLVAALSVQEVLLETPIAQADDLKKNMRQKWSATRRQWAGVGNSLLLGDPMVLLKAVGAAEYANLQGNLEKFCVDNGLRHKAVLEIRKLRLQLTQEIKLNVPDIDIIVDPKLKPPNDVQTKLLRQLMLASMGDQLARKISLEEIKENEDKAKFKYAYRAINMEEPVFLHQASVLRRTLPEFVVFQEIYEANKIYIRGVTAVEQEWLPTFVPALCNLSEPLAEPKPRFDSANGKVLCTVTGTFGAQAWPLSQVEIEFPDVGVGAYKWFAMFLLEGKVCGKLEKYSKALLYPPGALTKAWANSQPRIVALLKSLMSMRCRTRDVLESIWQSNPRFLLSEYLMWLPESAHAEVRLCWPPS